MRFEEINCPCDYSEYRKQCTEKDALTWLATLVEIIVNPPKGNLIGIADAQVDPARNNR
jgi:hypothetical protein